MGSVKKQSIKNWITIPNTLTMARIVGAGILLLFSPLSAGFFVVYSICGVTDVLDGYIARLTGQAGEIGAKLDSVADLLFYSMTLIKIFPRLFWMLPQWLWGATGGVVLIRVVSYLAVAVKYHRFASMHTCLNKLSSFMLFWTPYLMMTHYIIHYCVISCAVAAAAAVQELYLHVREKSYTSIKVGDQRS